MSNRITREDCVLVAIDYQTKLVPAMFDRENLIDASVRMIKGFDILGMPVIFTQQYTKGLGETIPEIREASTRGIVVEKMTFSAWDDADFVSKITKLKKKNIIVMGIEAHVCEQQTVLDMLEEGYNVFVPVDCISSRKAFDRDIAIERMRDAGAIITTYESILFEIMGWSKVPEFKQISALVK